MSNYTNKEKTNAFLDYFGNTTQPTVEFLVEELGWLIILKENIETVSDNWFTSSKYVSSSCRALDSETSSLLCFVNVYKKNATFIDNSNNVKYNLVFDEICLFADKIVAFF